MFARIFRARNLVVLLGVLVVAGGVYAFAAANVVPETGAGAGNNTISGYTITNVTYTLNSTDPQVLDAVDFSLAATAGAGTPTDVQVKLDASSSTWYSCADPEVDGTWTCDTTGTTLNVADMDQLDVVAAE